jgi:hypothetical protein
MIIPAPLCSPPHPPPWKARKARRTHTVATVAAPPSQEGEKDTHRCHQLKRPSGPDRLGNTVQPPNLELGDLGDRFEPNDGLAAQPRKPLTGSAWRALFRRLPAPNGLGYLHTRSESEGRLSQV